jgi:hypothetical protein
MHYAPDIGNKASGMYRLIWQSKITGYLGESGWIYISREEAQAVADRADREFPDIAHAVSEEEL